MVRAHLQDDNPQSALEAVASRSTSTTEGRTNFLKGQLYLTLDQGTNAQEVLATVTGRPWDACAESSRLDLLKQPRRALEALEQRGLKRAPCTLRSRALLAQRLGDGITEISSLRSLLRVDPNPEVRLDLISAIWRERGASAAIAELSPLIEAPPTGSRPLCRLADLLAEMQADQLMTTILQEATAAAAPSEVVSLARARFERLRGRPNSAERALDISSSKNSSIVARLEAAAIALDRQQPEEAQRHISGLELLECSPLWATRIELAVRASSRGNGDTSLEGSIAVAGRACAARGASKAVQRLAFLRIALAMESEAPLHELRALLSRAPEWPLSARRFDLLGRIEERSGDREAAISAYRRAIDLDAAHLSSLSRLAELEGMPEYRRQLDALIVVPDAASSSPADTHNRP